MSKTSQIALVLLLLVITDTRHAVAAPEAAAECSQFVQKFYDWYVAREKALSKANSQKDIMEVAMKEKRFAFSPELLKALQEDVAAARKDPDEFVGLDFDPILASQEEPERYAVGEVRTKGDSSTLPQHSPSLVLSGSRQMLNVAYLVDVFGFLEGKKDAKPTVVAELISKNGQWIFTNFHYDKDDLVSVLKQLKKDREQTKKRDK